MADLVLATPAIIAIQWNADTARVNQGNHPTLSNEALVVFFMKSKTSDEMSFSSLFFSPV